MLNFIQSFISNRRGFLRGAACIAVGAETARPADTGSEVDKLKKQLYEAQFSHLPQMTSYLKRLRDKFGPGVIEEIKAQTIEHGRRWTSGRPIPKEKRTLEVISQDYASWRPAIEYTWVEDTPQRKQVKVTRCRWAEEMKKLGADGELGFALNCASDYGYCAGLNPDIKFSRTKTLMQGHDCCNHTYELKS